MGCEMGLKVSLPLITIGAANAFGWLFVYLRGAIVIADWITGIAGHDPHLIMLLMVALFTVIGDFIEPVPTIIIFMPLVNALTDAGNINPVHMGVVLITTLAFGLITPPYGLVLLMASKFVDVRFSHVRSMSCSSLRSPSRFTSRQWCSGCQNKSFPLRSVASVVRAGSAISVHRKCHVRPEKPAAHLSKTDRSAQHPLNRALRQSS